MDENPYQPPHSNVQNQSYPTVERRTVERLTVDRDPLVRHEERVEGYLLNRSYFDAISLDNYVMLEPFVEPTLSSPALILDQFGDGVSYVYCALVELIRNQKSQVNLTDDLQVLVVWVKKAMNYIIVTDYKCFSQSRNANERGFPVDWEALGEQIWTHYL